MIKLLGSLRGTGRTGAMIRAYAFQLLMAAGIVLAFSTGVTSCEEADEGFVGDNVCLACHDGRISYDMTGFVESVHGEFGLRCEDCHGPGLDHVQNGGRLGLFIENPRDLGFTGSYQQCTECHITTGRQFETSVHFATQSANCLDCHNVHNDPPHQADFKDNAMCLQCHVAFEDDALLDTHIGPFHSVDPTGTGLGRCSICHMIPNSLRVQDRALHDHGMRPKPPSETLAEIDETGMAQTPNTCAGIMGCHDPNVPDSGNPRDINNVDLLNLLQNAYSTVGGLGE